MHQPALPHQLQAVDTGPSLLAEEGVLVTRPPAVIGFLHAVYPSNWNVKPPGEPSASKTAIDDYRAK
jgi:hypothetical protein